MRNTSADNPTVTSRIRTAPSRLVTAAATRVPTFFPLDDQIVPRSNFVLPLDTRSTRIDARIDASLRSCDATSRICPPTAALAAPAPEQRAVIVPRRFEDLTEAQTADALGCRVGTVKSQTRDALARLRRIAPGVLSGAEQDPSRTQAPPTRNPPPPTPAGVAGTRTQARRGRRADAGRLHLPWPWQADVAVDPVAWSHDGRRLLVHDGRHRDLARRRPGPPASVNRPSNPGAGGQSWTHAAHRVARARILARLAARPRLAAARARGRRADPVRRPLRGGVDPAAGRHR
ncbi:hypothetical protein Daura_35280 [Dactylosporangium aurantiacum]|uniref:RNA polymerase sigma factor 70 region 4 type 2 domain-containing protein n=1 Tax=Dactylosporangium aurantiacum TaxID=35754 RepID=A0A9Q9IEW9_9ACTN|nr:hypothetical protein Daura_35280 [Dactylosporangium aurantiacum]